MDFDIVSDLSDGSADTVPANVNDVDPNRVAPVREPVQQPTKVDTQAEPKPKALSLRDQISSAMKGEEATPQAAQAPEGPARNPDGTFAPKAAEGASQQPTAAVDPAGVADPASSPVQAPAGFDPQVFQSLPAETQQYVARTMDDVNNLRSRYAQYDQMEQLIAPRREAWALNGMTEAQAVNQLLALSDYATRDPAGFIQYFASNNGVNLEDVVFGQDPGDPETNELKTRIAQLEGFIQQSNQQQQQQAHRNTVNEVIAFFDQKDEAGNALRPYANDLGDSILPFIQVVMQQNPQMQRQQVLQEAYDRACWGNPTVRAKMQQAAATQAQADAVKAQQEKTQRARTASASVAPGVPNGSPPSPKDGNMSIRDTIKSTMASLS